MNGKYTVITGASSGIGYEVAKAFAKRGKNLIIAARRADRLSELKSEIPDADVVIKTVDLTDSESVHGFYDSVKNYPIETWINCAGFGDYSSVADSDIDKVERMIRLNVEALTVLSTLFVSDFHNEDGAQLINVSSCGGYIVVPNAVTYCATKFYVSSFTEGLARELIANGSKMRAKVFAPAATQTEFGKVANNVSEYDYDKLFGTYHTSAQAAELLVRLYDSDKTVGLVDRETFEFSLLDPVFPYAGNSAHNQKM